MIKSSLARTNRDESGRVRHALLLLVLASALLFVLLLATASAAHAQDTVVATPTGITADEVNAVARDLWCPLCSGVRLDTCELKACAQMRDVIAIKLGEGESPESIKAYFLDAYGPQVLGAPPLEGFNWLAWLLPAAVLVVGGALVVLRARGMMRRDPPTTPAISDAPAPPVHVEPSNPYERRLEDELKRHDSSL